MANSLYLRWFYIVLFGSTKCGVLPVCYSNSFFKTFIYPFKHSDQIAIIKAPELTAL